MGFLSANASLPCVYVWFLRLAYCMGLSRTVLLTAFLGFCGYKAWGEVRTLNAAGLRQEGTYSS